MRLVRFDDRFGPRWGRLDGDAVIALDGPPWPLILETDERLPLASVRLLAPVTPSKIVAVASNYPKHAAEMGRDVPTTPRIFFKPPSAVIGPGDAIRIPPGTTRVDPEGELAVVIGTRMHQVSPAEAMAGVLGYTALNDVTCRDFQKADGLFARAKGFDTFCPIGPWIETDLDPHDVGIRTIVNGDVRGHGRTSQMTFGIADLLAFVADVMTLEPGDVLSTGTPPGVAPLVDGDHVAVWIEGIGTLENPVVDRDDRGP